MTDDKNEKEVPSVKDLQKSVDQDAKSTDKVPMDEMAEVVEFHINDAFIGNAITATAQIDGVIDENTNLIVLQMVENPEIDGYSVYCYVNKPVLN